jgi:peptidoglycan/LPS O-acetylase OafA/YrhL
MDYIRSLDGLRAVAVFLVIISHADWLHVGWIGVQIFFVLSGFLITGILLRDKERQTEARSFLGRFYRRRTVRIFPLYFFALGLIALIDVVIGVRGFADSLPYLVTYTYNWGQANLADSPFFVHFWSLSVEEQFYLVWPLLIWVLPRRYFTSFTIGLILFGPVIRYATVMLVPLYGGQPSDGMGWFVYFASTSHLDAFAWGAAIAILHKRSVIWPRRSRYYVIGMFLLVLFLGGLNMVYYYPDVDWSALGYTRSFLATGTHIWGYTVINAFAAATLLYLVQHGSRLLESSFLCYIGQISYGIYVYHYGIWHVVDKVFDPDPYTVYGLCCLLVAMGLTLLISHASFKWLEKPFLRFKDEKVSPSPALSASLAQAKGN